MDRKAVGADEDGGTILGGNSGMIGHLVKVRKTLARPDQSYAGRQVDALADDHSHEVGGMCIGMVLDYGCHKHSAGVAEPGNKTMVQGAHKAVVDSP